MTPFSVQRIDHLVLRVENLDESVAFYEKVIGCTVERRRDELGLAHLRTGASLIDLISVSGKLGSAGGRAAADGGRNLDHLCLRIEPFDEAALRSHLSNHGVVPRGEVVQNFGAEGIGPSIYFSDLDGNVIEFKGPSERPAGEA
jgi:catechol 2,3-dioxygenase-like lactoylglutathione lyase family enzyme